MKKRFVLAVAIGLLLLVAPAVSAPLRNVPQKLVQPNGDVLECLASGDEHFNWLHDENGYVIIQNHSTGHDTSGYYTYAVKDNNGDLQPSQYIAGRVDPASVGLTPDIKPSPERLQQMLAASEAVLAESPTVSAPSTGTINNIVVFIRFKNEAEFTDQVTLYSDMFNSAVSGANSMLNYFNEVSYNALSVSTTFYPTPSGATIVSYQDTVNTRGYYQPFDTTTNPIGYNNDTELRDREHILLKDAVNAIASQVPTGLNLDGDNDGKVDNVCFIIDGSADGSNALLWPHMGSLDSQTAYINGIQVYTYNFQLQTTLLSSGVGVLCHEMMHSLGMPDLGHSPSDGMTTVGSWDIMEYDANPPQHPSAYMKYRYGNWISSIPVISSPGVYTLNPLTSSTNNCYKIESPNSSTEYYVVEYRKRSGTFENSLPGSGLLVYRINTAEDGQGNDQGPPDEVYVYRPGGTCSVNGSCDSANYSSDVGRIAIDDTTDPTPFLSNCAAGGLSISEVGSCGSTISFRLGAVPPCDSYDPDNTCAVANTIQPGVPQTHCIVPATDVDWVKFTLTQLSSVVLQTSGVSGDTRMWLYSDCSGTQLEYNDDGNGVFSRIDRVCGVDALPAGTYYVKVDEYGNNSEIPSYTLTLTVDACPITPIPPSNPSATNVTVSSIRWTWTDNSSDETGFKVYADPGPCSPVTLRATAAAASTYWDYGLTPNQLTANCQYCLQVAATNANGDSAKTSCITKYTLAGPPSYGNNIACNFSTGVWYPKDTTFTFTNPAGFGTSTHGGSQYKVSKFKYVWDTNPTHTWTGSESDWSSSTLPKSPTTCGSYYLHLRSYNAQVVGNPASVDLGPYKSDPNLPTTPVVTDDGAFQTDTTQLHAQWTCPEDTCSGICGYSYAIGTSATDPGSGYVLPWELTTNCEATEPGLSLQYGVIYYWYVKAKDCAGNWGTVGISDGIAVVQELSGSIAAAKMLPDSSSVGLSSKALTAVVGDTFYIQDSSGMGIRAQAQKMPAGLPANALVDVGGKMWTNSDGERFIQEACVLDTQTTQAVRSVGMNNRWLGGGDWHYNNVTGAGQQGIEDGVGLSSIGLLVRTWGKVVSAAVSGVFASWNLDTSPGWPMQGEWAFGTPTGGGGVSHGFPDPTSGYTGSNVYGVNLGGDYSLTAGGPYYLTTGPIDCSGKSGISLRFRRWLNSDYQTFAYATVEVSNNGTSWTPIWNNGATEIKESSWTLCEYPIPVADDMPSVYIRWSYQVASGAFAYSGWNIDDVEISGTDPLYVIDDGSGVGLRVVFPSGMTMPSLGAYISATGVCSCVRDTEGKIRPLLRVTGWQAQ